MAKSKISKTKNTEKSPSEEVTVDRRQSKDRRNNPDRRNMEVPVDEERRQTPRRKVPRRRQIDPTTCERDYNQDEIEFMHALDAYKRSAGRMFPTCSEILEVVRDLGYRRLTPEEIAKLQPGDAHLSDTAEDAVDATTEDELSSEDVSTDGFDDFEG